MVKNNKRHLTHWIGKTHLWLGLSSGLIVFIIAITGCIYAFEREIKDMTQPYRFVEQKSNKACLSPSAIEKIAEKELAGKSAHSVTYSNTGRSAEVAFYSSAEDYFYLVYVDQYTGEVLKVKDMSCDFFRVVLMIHFYLLLPPSIGQPIVASATLIFVVMLISGIVLWWPRNKNGAKQRFSIKWNSKWRRRNYDFHNVLGFYAFGIALILALTGLVWGFEWFAKSVYWTASGGKEKAKYYEVYSDTLNVTSKESNAVDKVWLLMNKEYPNAASVEVHYPEGSKTTIAANANSDDGTYWKTDYRYFDQYTLNEIPVNHLYGRFQNTSSADKLARMNYDIHVGAIIGLPGKILAFGASLIVASLPITGFLIWRGRKKKSKKTSSLKGKLKPAFA